MNWYQRRIERASKRKWWHINMSRLWVRDDPDRYWYHRDRMHYWQDRIIKLDNKQARARAKKWSERQRAKRRARHE